MDLVKFVMYTLVSITFYILETRVHMSNLTRTKNITNGKIIHVSGDNESLAVDDSVPPEAVSAHEPDHAEPLAQRHVHVLHQRDLDALRQKLIDSL